MGMGILYVLRLLGNPGDKSATKKYYLFAKICGHKRHKDVLENVPLDTPDKQFATPGKTVSVEPLAYRYSVYRLFRAYASINECLDDHFALLKRSLYSHGWEYRNDPREYVRRIAPICATSPDYADTLAAVINDVERYVKRLGL
jgi:hypothetical protein